MTNSSPHFGYTVNRWVQSSRRESAFSEQAEWVLSLCFLFPFSAFLSGYVEFTFVLLLVPLVLLMYAQLSRMELEFVLEQLLLEIHMPQQVTRGVETKIDFVLINDSEFPLSNFTLALHKAQGVSESFQGILNPFSRFGLSALLTYEHRMDHYIWGVRIQVSDRLGLVKAERHFVYEPSVQVLPARLYPQLMLSQYDSFFQFSPLQVSSIKGQRKLSSDGEFRELRAYQSSDYHKHIAWRASARRGQLLTQTFDQVSQIRYVIALDLCAFMRQVMFSEPRSAMALDIVDQLLQSLHEEEVGIVVFDHRLMAELPIAPLRLTQARWRQLSPYLTQALAHDCVSETQDELWEKLSRYLTWIGIDDEAQKAGLAFEPHFKPSLRLQASLSRDFMARWLLAQTHLSTPAYIKDLGEDEVDTRLRLFCYSKGLFGTPYVARAAQDLAQGLQQVFQSAKKQRASHLVIVGHSHRLLSSKDQHGLRRWLDSSKALTWIQVASTSESPPKEFASFASRMSYIPIRISSERLPSEAKKKIVWKVHSLN